MKKLGTQKRTSLNGLINYAIVIGAYVLLRVLMGAGLLSNSLQSVLVPACCYMVMAVSLNLVVGISGELSLGHAGFMSLGAFSGIVAAVALQNLIPFAPLRLAVAMAVGAAFGALGGFVVGVPVLRLRGDYLAIVTLAFGQIIQNIIMVLYVGVDAKGIHVTTDSARLVLAEGGTAIVKGPMGAVGAPKLATFTAGAALLLVTLFVAQNLVNSRSGRAILALRDNRIAAESVGIPAGKYKLMAFVTSAALAGAAGALFGLNYSSTVASKFNFNTSILVLVFVVLGGLGNIRGSMVAAALLYVLPELLRGFNIAEYRMLVYAVILILVMLFTNNPTLQGFFGGDRERRFQKAPKGTVKGGGANE